MVFPQPSGRIGAMVSLVDGSKATTPAPGQQPDAIGRQKRLAEIAENAEIPQRVGNASA
jgi:hypothetical protein